MLVCGLLLLLIGFGSLLPLPPPLSLLDLGCLPSGGRWSAIFAAEDEDEDET